MKNNIPVTKEELEKALVKMEAKLGAKMVTKEEAKQFATKEELKATEKILRAEIRQTAEETKKDIREEIKQSSSKILDVLDGFLGEMKTSEEERTINSYRISNHDDRITVLEQKVGVVTV